MKRGDIIYLFIYLFIDLLIYLFTDLFTNLFIFMQEVPLTGKVICREVPLYI